MPEITGPRRHSQAGAVLSVEINCLNKQGAAMRVIDVQVHPFDRNHPGRPWASPSHGLDSATGDEMVAAMNSVGVEGAPAGLTRAIPGHDGVFPARPRNARVRP